ncbi:hypothetical protein [Accumulibacter sp.]|uniref:hypothetical protein n=1 Tax=Accumulibacter sp. TaxID=2053492 RepID=UPI0026359DB9|nr:hypothetical protein [Accumulibacter sp.]
MLAIKTLILAAASSAFMLASQPLLAHSDEYLDTQKAPNGGQLRMAGPYHFELVVSADNKEAAESPVVVHVSDHAGAKVATAGATGTATILAGKNKTTANLAPDGDNRMKGSAKYASTPDMKVVVSITVAGKTAEQARFTPLAVSH